MAAAPASPNRARHAAIAFAIALILAAVALPRTAEANRIQTLRTPSRFVDTNTAVFGDVDPRPRALHANILLPDGYDPERRYPVLYLLHGAGENYASWDDPAKGDVERTLDGLDAIVVMPDGGLGFYSNWWNGGERGNPSWERYHLEQLVPLIENRYRIRPDRRWHAIAGFSMGGYGTAHYAALRPDYFGTAVPMSGFVSIQRPQAEAGLSLVAGVDYDAIFGPGTGFYAEGSNPVRLADNLRYSRVMAYTGNAVPRPDVPTDAAAAASAIVEAEVMLQTQELVAALERVGAEASLVLHPGVHDWPYWREDISDAVRRGIFRPIAELPREWTYRTVERRGRAWDLSYRFRRPPGGVARLERNGRMLRLSGRDVGPLQLRTDGGCELTLRPDEAIALPPRGCGPR